MTHPGAHVVGRFHAALAFACVRVYVTSEVRVNVTEMLILGGSMQDRTLSRFAAVVLLAIVVFTGFRAFGGP